MDPDINPHAEEKEWPYRPAPVFRAEHAESRLTRLVEQQSAKIPSDLFLFLSLAAMLLSFSFELTRRRRASRFVGMWVSPLLLMGVYNKLVKTFGAR